MPQRKPGYYKVTAAFKAGSYKNKLLHDVILSQITTRLPPESSVESVFVQPFVLVSLNNYRLSGKEFFAYLSYFHQAITTLHRNLQGKLGGHVSLTVQLNIILGDSIFEAYESKGTVEQLVQEWRDLNARELAKIQSAYPTLNIKTRLMKLSDFDTLEIYKEGVSAVEQTEARDAAFKEAFSQTVGENRNGRTYSQASEYLRKECAYHFPISDITKGKVIFREKNGTLGEVIIPGFYQYPEKNLNKAISYIQEKYELPIVYVGYRSSASTVHEDAEKEMRELKVKVEDLTYLVGLLSQQIAHLSCAVMQPSMGPLSPLSVDIKSDKERRSISVQGSPISMFTEGRGRIDGSSQFGNINLLSLDG